MKVVQERLGQASAVETLKRYSRPLFDERTRQVVERTGSAPDANLADSVRTGDDEQASDQGVQA